MRTAQLLLTAAAINWYQIVIIEVDRGEGGRENTYKCKLPWLTAFGNGGTWLALAAEYDKRAENIF
jgi:hypothetical protein